jgi:uncharacterized membrane protein YgdD (TMEM256/DUF423 family)
MNRRFIALGALFGLLGVLGGTFAAHGLKDRLSPDMLAIFETGVRYQMYQALALILVGIVCREGNSRLIRASGVLFAVGIVVFSGSLYALSLSGMKWWGMITPVGGGAFLAGWALLALGAFRHRS